MNLDNDLRRLLGIPRGGDMTECNHPVNQLNVVGMPGFTGCSHCGMVVTCSHPQVKLKLLRGYASCQACGSRLLDRQGIQIEGLLEPIKMIIFH
jgi:hypothetical protein